MGFGSGFILYAWNCNSNKLLELLNFVTNNFIGLQRSDRLLVDDMINLFHLINFQYSEGRRGNGRVQGSIPTWEKPEEKPLPSTAVNDQKSAELFTLVIKA